MRRIVSVLVLAVVAALLHAVVPPQAIAGAVIAGQVVQQGTDVVVPGTTVRLHVDDGGARGATVDTEVTDAEGRFVLSPTSDGAHWIEVVRNNKIQGGYVQDRATGPSYVVPVAEATSVLSGTDVGRALALPSFVSGVVVNAANGNRLGGINVSTRDVTALGVVLHADTTDSNGFFRIPVWGEEFGLRVNGGSRGFENGWVGCARGVVPTWGQACSHAPGRLGRIRLDRV